ncbi:MAG: hypothetical protein BWX78_01755 [Firmicutes bacterium ADurb.Bin099]|nr:MAG: hypothetical protein BWX78_01755 [Firmicutes bacterium ADurb.Bin099]
MVEGNCSAFILDKNGACDTCISADVDMPSSFTIICNLVSPAFPALKRRLPSLFTLILDTLTLKELEEMSINEPLSISACLTLYTCPYWS